MPYINKNDNNWFVIIVFPSGKIVLSVDFLNQINVEIETIFQSMKKYYLFHEEKFSKSDWRVVRYAGLEIKKKQ